MNLTDIDAIELADTLNWIAEFLTQADPVPDLINDLHEWTHQLTEKPPT